MTNAAFLFVLPRFLRVVEREGALVTFKGSLSPANNLWYVIIFSSVVAPAVPSLMNLLLSAVAPKCYYEIGSVCNGGKLGVYTC